MKAQDCKNRLAGELLTTTSVTEISEFIFKTGPVHLLCSKMLVC
jgi:hypothetical protein